MNKTQDLEVFSNQITKMLQKGNVPHPEINHQTTRHLKENFPVLENPRKELSRLLVRSDKYTLTLIDALEKPATTQRVDEKTLAAIAQGKDPNKPTPKGYTDFDDGHTLKDIFINTPEDERGLIVFNMVVNCLAEPVVGGDRVQTINTRLNNLVPLLLSTEISSLMPEHSNWPPRVKERDDLKMKENIVGAGNVLGRILDSSRTFTENQINERPLMEAITQLKRYDVAPSLDSILANALNLATYIAYNIQPKTQPSPISAHPW